MSLHYLVKLEMLIARVLQLHCYPEFVQPQLWFPNSQNLNPVDNSVWKILQEGVYKTCITDLELSMTPLTDGCHNDDVHDPACFTPFSVAVSVRLDQ